MKVRVSVHLPAKAIVAGQVVDMDEAGAKALIAQGFASEPEEPSAEPPGGAHVATADETAAAAAAATATAKQ